MANLFNYMPDYTTQMQDPRTVLGGMPVAQGPRGGVVGGGMLAKLMPAPVSGLLSEADVRNARNMGLIALGTSLLTGGAPSRNQRGTLANVGEALQQGLGTYQGGLDHAINRRGAEQQYETGQLQQQVTRGELEGQQRAQAEREAILARRQEILAKFPPPTNGTSQDAARWAATVWPYVAGSPDTEFAEQIRGLAVVGMQMDPSSRGESVDTVGPDGKPIRRWATQEELRQGVPVYVKPQASDASMANRIETLVNPATGKPEMALVDPRTGRTTFTGQTPATSGAATEGERKAASLLHTIGNTSVLDAADAPDRMTQFLSKKGVWEAVDEDQQVFFGEGEIIAEAWLRLKSGGAITADEVAKEARMMVPMPGDKPRRIAQKRMYRQRVLEALKTAAGRAYKEPSEQAPASPTLDELWEGM